VGSPIIGLAFLNSILFASYGGIMRALEEYSLKSSFHPTLSQVYIAGFGAGIACFLASTPTELVKCRAQVYPNSSTWEIFKSILFSQGIRGKINIHNIHNIRIIRIIRIFFEQKFLK